MDTSEPRPRFPQWTREEQNFWLESFGDFTSQLLAARLEAWAENPKSPMPREAMGEDIELASALADIAVVEMQYRFELSKRDEPEKGRRRIIRTEKVELEPEGGDAN